MVSVPSLSRTLQILFTTTADHLARETKAVQRESKCTGAILARTLVFGWLHDPVASRSTLAGVAALSGVTISPQGLSARLNAYTAAFLERLFAAAVQVVITADPVAIPLLARFPGGVWIEDSTTLRLPDALAERWPGCGGLGRACRAAMKLGVRLNLRDGALQGPVLGTGREHDRTISPRLPLLRCGALWIVDLGYFSLARFAALSRRGVATLSRIQAGTHLRTSAEAASIDVGGFLARAKRRGEQRIDQPVLVGATERWACRLVAVRVPPRQAARRRRAIRRDAKRNGVTPSASRLALADWNAYVTTLGPQELSIAEVLVLARARWQIELLFKLWKSAGKLASWQSNDPDAILCELFAKGLGMVVQHWLLLTAAWANPHRSLTKGAGVVRSRVLELAAALACGRRVQAVVSAIRGALRVTAAMERRRTHPSTAQLLLDPSLDPLAPPKAA